MKVFTRGNEVRVELTRRNLIALLEKLDDPLSARTLVKDVEEPSTLTHAVITAVEDEAHYTERAPGAVYMPTSGRRY